MATSFAPSALMAPKFVAYAGAEPAGKQPKFTLDTYLRFGFAGALCCSITHTAVVPLDVVKTQMQLYPGKYKGMIDGLRKIPAEYGPAMLFKGAGPTAVGYFLQGAFKFGFNEFFKKQFAVILGAQNAQTYRVPMWLGASACAEFIADLFLCPLEATRIRLVSQPTYAKGLADGSLRILREEGVMAFYKGLPPLLLKQIPYTMAKFSVFEMTAEAIYGVLPPKSELSQASQLSVSFVSGIVAGVAAAVISQPADTVLSKINKQRTDGGMWANIGKIVNELGARGLFLGMGARAVMVGTITSGQFFIYDYCKLLMGVSPAQLAAKAEKAH